MSTQWQGNAIVKEQQELFKKYENVAGISNNLVVVYTAVVFQMTDFLSEGNYEQAWNQLQKLNGAKVSSVLQDIVDYFYLQAAKGRKNEEYLEYKKKLMERKIVPAIADKMK